MYKPKSLIWKKNDFIFTFTATFIVDNVQSCLIFLDVLIKYRTSDN